MVVPKINRAMLHRAQSSTVYAFVIGLVAVSGSLASRIAAADETKPVAHATAAERLFTLKVFPVLNEKCFGCHGNAPDDLKGELDMRSLENLLAGGETEEPSIVIGKPDESLLVHSIEWTTNEMPPKENDRLTQQQINDVRKWIEMGAAWPDQEKQQEIREQAAQEIVNEDGVLVMTSGGTSDAWTSRRYQSEDLWAWQPVVTPDLEGMPRTPSEVIDFLVDQKLADSGYDPAGEADAETLIRRASYDLIGLPPTQNDILAFKQLYQADPDAAWDGLIEQLLASPHYGERWAQHWLDVTRYADTGGMSNDYERSNLWRYRDYVIRSFSDDKPYNEFIVEQLAGDELADESVAKRKEASVDSDVVWKTQLKGDYTPEETEWLVATGFLRVGPWDNAMIEADEARQIYLDDVVNVVGQTFLSTTMRCFKCHDHKFDPLPTRDYYRVYSAFATTHLAERNVPFLKEENRQGFEQGKTHVKQMLDYAKEKRDELIGKREAAAKAWFSEHDLPYKDENARKNLPDEEKPPRHVGLDHVEQGRLKVREQDVWIWQRRLERYKPMAQSVFNAGSAKLAWNGARGLRIDKNADRKDSPKNHILLGGALTALGDAVQPGVLSATKVPVSLVSKDLTLEDPYRLPSSVQGRRLGFARWVADERNPLTARSFVNRIWQHHFGKGIAANTNSFGAKGSKPTHPELLDYLASDFMSNGWTLKRMHRAMMKSKTYKRANDHPRMEELAIDDPGNQLLSVFPRRRLTAEEIRDSMLTMSGELSRDVGGLPVMPEINMEVALQPRMIQFSLAPAYQPSRTPKERNRRTIYAYRVRGMKDPMLEIFNQSNPNESCEQRDDAAVTPQVFTLLNSDMVNDRAIAIAMKLIKQAGGPKERVDLAFRTILGRPAKSSERDRLTNYLQDMVTYHTQGKVAAPVYPTEITRSLVEEFTGKPFEYIEILPRFEMYVADTKAHQVDASTRALADLCLLLMNTNEFMYIN